MTLIDHENKAVAISAFQAMLVPGLLQSGDYARAVISSNVNIPADEAEDRVAKDPDGPALAVSPTA